MDIQYFLLLKHEILLTVAAIVIIFIELFLPQNKKTSIINISIVLFAIITFVGFIPTGSGTMFGGSFEGSRLTDVMKDILNLLEDSRLTNDPQLALLMTIIKDVLENNSYYSYDLVYSFSGPLHTEINSSNIGLAPRLLIEDSGLKSLRNSIGLEEFKILVKGAIIEIVGNTVRLIKANDLPDDLRKLLIIKGGKL